MLWWSPEWVWSTSNTLKVKSCRKMRQTKKNNKSHALIEHLIYLFDRFHYFHWSLRYSRSIDSIYCRIKMRITLKYDRLMAIWQMQCCETEMHQPFFVIEQAFNDMKCNHNFSSLSQRKWNETLGFRKIVVHCSLIFVVHYVCYLTILCLSVWYFHLSYKTIAETINTFFETQ